MSYNPDSFRLKHVHLVLPLGFDIMTFSPTRAISPIEVDSDLKTWSYNEGGEGFSMGGTVDLKRGLVVDTVDCAGEGGGNDYYDIMIPLFEKYKCDLEASLVWEGGDSINRIIIKNGETKEEDIDI